MSAYTHREFQVELLARYDEKKARGSIAGTPRVVWGEVLYLHRRHPGHKVLGEVLVVLKKDEYQYVAGFFRKDGTGRVWWDGSDVKGFLPLEALHGIKVMGEMLQRAVERTTLEYNVSGHAAVKNLPVETRFHLALSELRLALSELR